MTDNSDVEDHDCTKNLVQRKSEFEFFFTGSTVEVDRECTVCGNIVTTEYEFADQYVEDR
jgi:hypothetical protein